MFAFNLWLSTFLLKVRMVWKPEKSLCELSSVDCTTLLREIRDRSYSTYLHHLSGTLHLGAGRLLAGYLWSSFTTALALEESISDAGKNVVAVLLKDIFYLWASRLCQINILAGNSILAASSFLRCNTFLVSLECFHSPCRSMYCMMLDW